MLWKKRKVLFEECAMQWLKEKREIRKESTTTTYFRILSVHLLPTFGKMPVKEISKEKVRTFMKQKEENGRADGTGGLSAKSCRDIFAVLMAVLQYAEETYGIEDALKRTKPREIVSVPQKMTMDTLTEEECRKLAGSLFSKGDGEAIGILLSLFTGIRLGEVCALRWENIDLERNIFRVRETMARVLADGREDCNEQPSEKSNKMYQRVRKAKTKLVFTVPKTQSSIRDVPIPEILRPLLFRQENKTGFLLTGNETYMDMRTLQNHFKKILKENGLRAIRFHCLRHTFATNCVNLEFDIKTISEILGHSSTTVTWERYVHSSMHRKQILMRKLAERMCV